MSAVDKSSQQRERPSEMITERTVNSPNLRHVGQNMYEMLDRMISTDQEEAWDVSARTDPGVSDRSKSSEAHGSRPVDRSQILETCTRDISAELSKLYPKPAIEYERLVLLVAEYEQEVSGYEPRQSLRAPTSDDQQIIRQSELSDDYALLRDYADAYEAWKDGQSEMSIRRFLAQSLDFNRRGLKLYIDDVKVNDLRSDRDEGAELCSSSGYCSSSDYCSEETQSQPRGRPGP